MKHMNAKSYRITDPEILAAMLMADEGQEEQAKYDALLNRMQQRIRKAYKHDLRHEKLTAAVAICEELPLTEKDVENSFKAGFQSAYKVIWDAMDDLLHTLRPDAYDDDFYDELAGPALIGGSRRGGEDHA